MRNIVIAKSFVRCYNWIIEFVDRNNLCVAVASDLQRRCSDEYKKDRRNEKMKRRITLPDLKKRLKEMDKTDLEKLIYNMYKENKTVEQLVNVEFLGREYEEEQWKEYDAKLEKLFYPKDIVRTGFSAVAAKKVLKEFLSVCKDEALQAKAKLTFVEYGVDLIDTYGGAEERLYDYIMKYFHEVVEYSCEDKEFRSENDETMKNVVAQSEWFGYGLGDELSEEYNMLS